MSLDLAKCLLGGKIVLTENCWPRMMIETHMCLARGFPRTLLVNRLGLGYRSYNPHAEVWGLSLHHPSFMRQLNLVLKSFLFHDQ